MARRKLWKMIELGQREHTDFVESIAATKVPGQFIIGDRSGAWLKDVISETCQRIWSQRCHAVAVSEQYIALASVSKCVILNADDLTVATVKELDTNFLCLIGNHLLTRSSQDDFGTVFSINNQVFSASKLKSFSAWDAAFLDHQTIFGWGGRYIHIWKKGSGRWKRVREMELSSDARLTGCPAKADGEVYFAEGTKVFLWNYQTDAKAVVYKARSPVTSLCYLRDRKMLLIGDESGVVTLHNDASPKRSSRLKVHSDWINHLAATEQGWVISASRDRTVRSWSLDARPKNFDPMTCPAGVDAVAWNEELKLLAAGGWDGLLRIWNAKGELILEHVLRAGALICFLEFGPSNTVIVGYGKDVVSFERLSFVAPVASQPLYSNVSRRDSSVFYWRCGSLKYAELNESGVIIRDVVADSESASFIEMDEIFFAQGWLLALSNDRQLLALCNSFAEYCEVRVYHVPSKTLRVREVFLITYPPASLAVSNSGQVIIGWIKNEITTLNEDGEQVSLVKFDADAPVSSVQISESGNTIACGLGDSRCFILERR